LIDVDGTLLAGDGRPMPGAPGAMATVRPDAVVATMAELTALLGLDG